MSTRALASTASLAAVIAAVLLASVPIAGQSASSAPTTPENWTPPRTLWGHPDIQGNFTNLYEVGTPFERPDEYAGRRLEDITGEELARVRRAIQDRTREQFLDGEIGGARWMWLDSHDHVRGSSAWFVVDPPDGRMPPLTPEAQRRIAAQAEARRNSGRGPADSYTDRSLYDRCISRGLPGSMMPAIYGNSYHILQAPDYVAIRYEMIHETRIIPLDGRPHLGRGLRQYMGDARGRWDGDTLVVETTNFRPELTYRNARADTLRIVERFTRVAPDKVRWAVTVDDPDTWTRPWTFAMNLTENDEERMFEYACHEGNIALKAILSGARAEERAAQNQAR